MTNDELQKIIANQADTIRALTELLHVSQLPITNNLKTPAWLPRHYACGPLSGSKTNTGGEND